MAEIRIQRKRRRKLWPWLLGLLVVAVLPLPFLADREGPVAPGNIARLDTVATRDTVGRADTVVPRDTTTRVTATAAGTLGSASRTPAAAADTSAAVSTAPTMSPFDRFITARDPSPSEHAHRQYMAEALRRLADELRTLGASQESVTSMRLHADSLRTPAARRRADVDHARAAFLAAVREFDLLRERGAAAVDTARLRSTAWALRSDRALLAQRGTVQAFLESARDALNALSRER